MFLVHRVLDCSMVFLPHKSQTAKLTVNSDESEVFQVVLQYFFSKFMGSFSCLALVFKATLRTPRQMLG